MTETLTNGELLPHDERAEVTILGSIMGEAQQGRDAFDGFQQLGALRPADFWKLLHQLTFTAIQELREPGLLPTPEEVVRYFKPERLPDNERLFYGREIARLPCEPPRQAVVRAIETVRGFSLRRALIGANGDPEIVRWELARFENNGQQADELRKILAARRFDRANPPPPPREVYRIGSIVVSTGGNLTGVTGHAKAGKSAFVNASMASVMNPGKGDTFTINSSNPRNWALLHFDTEQDPALFHEKVLTATRRAGLETEPEWLRSHCLTGLTPSEVRELVKQEMADAKKEFGGIHSVLLDGLADSVWDVNDTKEAISYVTELHATAIEYDCPILGILHLNPGSDSKSRGHLGSQLERKAESNLMLAKEGDDTTVIWSDKQRRAPILKQYGPRFRWSDDAKMHVSCETGANSKEREKIERFQCELDDVFNGRHALRYTELLTTVKNSLRVSDRTAERRLKEYVRLHLVSKGIASLWERVS